MKTVTLRNDVYDQLDRIRTVNIVVGIHSYNSALTINHVVRAVQAGWAKAEVKPGMLVGKGGCYE